MEQKTVIAITAAGAVATTLASGFALLKLSGRKVIKARKIRRFCGISICK